MKLQLSLASLVFAVAVVGAAGEQRRTDRGALGDAGAIGHDTLAGILPDICLGRRFRKDAELRDLHVHMNRLRRDVADVLPHFQGVRLENLEVIRQLDRETYCFHPEIRVLGLVAVDKLANLRNAV